jgi:hypothetical protein
MSVFHRQDSVLQRKIAELKEEIVDRDYRIIKAFRLGKTLEELYPGETVWYEGQVAKINALEQQAEGQEG